MKSQIIVDAERDYREAEEETARIYELRRKLDGEVFALDERLRDLRNSLPELLVAVEMGEERAERVNVLRSQIEATESRLSDIPLIKAGLDERERPVRKKQKSAHRVIEKYRSYQEKKALLAENHTDTEENLLRTLADYLDMKEDARSFLAGLKPAA
ncbi:MAG: hypothetical protein K9L59_10115 [Desulfobacterales bacterium]|nr:hypothetical protein [Desulfobacterales bacterium]